MIKQVYFLSLLIQMIECVNITESAGKAAFDLNGKSILENITSNIYSDYNCF